MREISLDTETTGLEAEGGDRIVEIGCVELENLMPTGRTFHVYIDPQRPMSAEASRITGITDEMLVGKPLFADIISDFRQFIEGGRLVIHNAAFDVRFINAEFARCGAPPLDRAMVTDTLAIAKRRFPGAQANLDALCRRFGVDNSNRTLHGALLDAELLAEVYLELSGGRQPDLMSGGGPVTGSGAADPATDGYVERRDPRLSHRVTAEERAAHDAFVSELGDAPLWRQLSET